jgi:Fe2+ transport system protein FeoA
MKTISLAQMKEDQKGKVVQIAPAGSFQHKMMSMGIYKGREITKLSHFALRGPVTIRVGRSVIALGHAIAHKIWVEVE